MPVQSNIYDARRRMEDALVQTDVLWKKKYELRQHLVHQAQHHHQAFPRDSSEDTDVDDPLSKVVSNSISKMHILSLIHDSLDTQHSQEQEEAFGRGLSNHPSSNHRDEGSGLDHVRIVSDQWQAMIADEVRSLAKEQNSGHALVRRRSYAASTEEMKLAATSASFLFDTSDLLEAIKDIQPLNETQEAQEQHWGLLQVKLALVPTWSQLQTRYHELQPRLSSSYSHEGTPVLANCSHRALAKACRVGLAQGSRAKCWMQALDRVSGRKDTDQQQRAMEEILIQVPRAPEDPPLEDLHVHENATDAPMSLEYITDAVYYADVMEMGNHVDYFPFVEILTQVMLAFSRDPWIHEHVQVDAFPRIFDKTTDEQMLIPPSGVQPYRGLVLYVAPLCYLYENPNDLYRVFRQMYTRYWVKLQAIETRHSDSLLGICEMFENLVHAKVPQDTWTCIQLEIEPLEIMFPAIHAGFSGYLSGDQVLVLWDRIVGYESLEIVAIFAAAYFCHRLPDILKLAKSQHDQGNESSSVQDIIQEWLRQHRNGIEVSPVIQHFVFGSSSGSTFTNEDNG